MDVIDIQNNANGLTARYTGVRLVANGNAVSVIYFFHRKKIDEKVFSPEMNSARIDNVTVI